MPWRVNANVYAEMPMPRFPNISRDALNLILDILEFAGNTFTIDQFRLGVVLRSIDF